MTLAQDPHELLAVVDEQDREIAAEQRHLVHSRGLLHRAVHVFVHLADGRLLLQQRSALKETAPLHWECVGGHLAPGEDYLTAAQREVQEELGVAATDFDWLGKVPACAENGLEFVDVWSAVIHGEPSPSVAEVMATEANTMSFWIDEILAERRPFSPSMIVTLQYLGVLPH